MRILDGDAEFGGVQLHKTGGQHGSDALYAIPELAQSLGDIMGVVFEAPGQKTTYVVGDTVWRDEVERALERYNPEVIVLNTSAAEVTGFEGDPIIMGQEDTLRTHQAVPNATIIAVHMDAVNHMTGRTSSHQPPSQSKQHQHVPGVATRPSYAFVDSAWLIGFYYRFKPRPRYATFHLLEKPLLARFLLLGRVRQRGKAGLFHWAVATITV